MRTLLPPRIASEGENVGVEKFNLHVEKVYVWFQPLNIKVLKIPKRCRQGNGVPRTGSRLESLLQTLGQRDEVRVVLITTSSIISYWVLPVEINAVKVVFLKELNDGLDKLVHVLRAAGNIAKGGTRWARIVERPATHSDIGLEVRISQLEGVQAFVELDIGL